jgi:hypothetical protein
MKVALGYVWIVVGELVLLVAVVAMLRAAHSPFEVIVVSGLISIYSAGEWGRAQLYLLTRQRWTSVGVEIFRLRRVLNDPDETAEENFRAAALTLYHDQRRMELRGLFVSIDYFIVLWYLGRALAF